MASENPTDLGNAKRLVRLHGKDLRYIHEFARWFVWGGTRWKADTTGEIVRRAKDVPRDLYQAAAGAETDDGRTASAKWAYRTEAEVRLRALISLAQSELPASPDDFDADPWILNTTREMVDLRSGDSFRHAREEMCSKVAGSYFDPTIRSELWEQCLATWLPDPEVRAFVKRAVGYSLIGSVTEQALLIVWGSGANGKSVFLETIRAALGDYALQTPAETLISNRSTGIPNDVARLKGARFVSASESDENRRLAEAKVKALTGGDTISARFMRAEWFDFVPTFTVWLSTNHKPIVRGSDEGIWRRIKLIPFTVTIPEGERDGQLQERLRAELPAVLAWAVEGCLEYQKRGLDSPQGVTGATDDYRRESDVFGEFLEERCIVEPGRFTTAAALYEAYRIWMKAAGEEPVTKTALGKRLTERGFDKRKGPGGHRGWDGIAVAGPDE